MFLQSMVFKIVKTTLIIEDLCLLTFVNGQYIITILFTYGRSPLDKTILCCLLCSDFH